MTRILIIKIGAIGDVIGALPVLPVIKEKYPTAHITWICGTTAAPILERVPAIDTIIYVNEHELVRGTLFKKISALWSLYLKVGFRTFDAIYDFHVDFRYRALSLFSFGKFFKFSRKSERPIPLPGRTRSEEHIRLVINQDSERFARSDFPEMNFEPYAATSPQWPVSAKTVILLPGGAKNFLSDQFLRRWPVENYRELASALLRDGCTVIINGSATDLWVLESFVGIPVINMVGKLSLNQTIALFRTISCVVTHDSGPFHMAVLAQKPQVVGVFGPTNPHEVTYKNTGKISIVWGGENLACRPCYYGKHFADCTNNICMQLATVETVHKEINNIFAARN